MLSVVTTASVDYLSDPVPSGYIWVVRDVVMKCETGGVLPGKCVAADSGGNTLANVDVAQSMRGRSYHFELRQVLDAGENLVVQSDQDGWEVKISGYQLSLP